MLLHYMSTATVLCVPAKEQNVELKSESNKIEFPLSGNVDYINYNIEKEFNNDLNYHLKHNKRKYAFIYSKVKKLEQGKTFYSTQYNAILTLKIFFWLNNRM